MTSPAPRRGVDDADVVLAIDIGGTKVSAALVAPEGRIIEGSKARRATGRDLNREGFTAVIDDLIRETLQSLPVGRSIRAVGIGSAGPVERSAGCVSPINLPALKAFPIRDVVAARVPGVPVRLALDGTCIALAEHRLGAARGARNSLSMVVSTGIGGGFVIEGRVAHGSTGNAGHIGQTRIEPWEGGDPHHGTLEAIASGPNTVAWARARGWHGSSGEDLAIDYSAGDRIAREAVTRSARAVGQAIANACTLLDLDVVVLAGGFVDVAEEYTAIAQDHAREVALLPYAREALVIGTGLDGDGPILGAGLVGLLDEGQSHDESRRRRIDPASPSDEGRDRP